MSLFEDGGLELDEDINDIKDDEFGDFADDEELKDLVFDIPGKSKIYESYGHLELSEKDWEARDPCDFDVHHYNLSNSIREPFKFMSTKSVPSAEAKNNFLDDFVDNIKQTCQTLLSLEDSVLFNDIDNDKENSQNNGNKDSNDKDNANIDTEYREDFKTMLQDLAENEMTPFNMKTAVDSYYIGRIRFGYQNHRISNKNIGLEASVSHGNGLVVPLDLSLVKNNASDSSPLSINSSSSKSFENDGEVEAKKMKMDDKAKEVKKKRKEVSLFPGQIVIIKAQNPTGDYLRVMNFYPISAILKPSFPVKPSKILSSDIPIHIAAASGPFVSIDGPDFDLTNVKYMRALADYVKAHRPNVLLLCGPFFDLDHLDRIMEWSTRQTLTEKYGLPCNLTIEKLVQIQLRAFTKELEGQYLGTRVCYLPSPMELASGNGNVFPTWPGELKATVPMQSFASPSLLSVDGVAVGVSTADVLTHLSRFEISTIENAGAERLKRLCSHVLDHRHFYPLSPPDPSLNLESSLYEKLSMAISPNLLILPSILRPFAFEVNKTVVINPGRVCRNTIARIRISPVDPTKWTGNLSDNINAEIIKLIQ